jgi:flagellar biosynthesis GTPase FlhF
MINITPAGDVAVGFTDTSANPVENYYLKVGRSQNGWTVKSADPAAESVTLEKGGVDVTVKLGETSGGGKANGSKRGRGHRPMTLQSRGGAPVATSNAEEEKPTPPLLGNRPLGGLANLRKRRAEEMRKAKAEAERKAEAEAVAAAEREEKAAREEEEKRIRESEEKRIRAEEAEQERKETIRQLMEQIKKDRDAKEAEQQQGEQEI